MVRVAVATVQTFLARTTASAREESHASRFTIKQMNTEYDEGSLSASDDDDEGQYYLYSCVYRRM